MDDLIKTFHIDWRLLTAQIINFAIVVAVLGFFAVKPLIKLMKERQEKIARGVEDANLAQQNLKEAAVLKEKEIAGGRVQASAIISQAEKDAEGVKVEKMQKTLGEVEKVISGAREKIKTEKENMVKDAKKEVADLVVLALDKLVGNALDEKAHKKLIGEAIKEVGQLSIKT